MNHENDNTTGTSPPTINPDSISESLFPPESATTNTAILEMNKNPSLETVAGTSAAVATVATSSAAANGSDNNLSLKRAFVPVDPALGGRGAEMGIKKAKKENDKARAAELKEQHFFDLKSEMRKQTNTQERLVFLYELCSLIKTAMMTKNKNY
jgi:hypothetical protein